MIDGHPRIHQENFNTKILAPTSIMTWLQDTVGKYSSGANVAESEQELITIAIEYFVILPTVTCTHWYDQRFGILIFWKSTRSLNFYSEQIWAFWEFCDFSPNSNANFLNFLTVVNPSS
jgi:hypothetical protein